MRRFLFIIAVGLLTACGGQKKEANEAYVDFNKEKGDSCLYGLVCEGCTDSVLVVLPYEGGDPQTFNIIKAMMNRKIYGRPNVGDNIALIINKEDSTVCDYAINLNELKGTWCYEQEPTIIPMPGETKEQALRHFSKMPDSIRMKEMQPRIFGFELQGMGNAHTIGIQPSGSKEHTRFEYEEPKLYDSWRTWNRYILLISSKEKQGDSLVSKTSIDTFSVKMMRRDTLVLVNNNGKELGLYRQATNNIKK